ncbi:uncharacterized protein LOC141660889 [Apium graveolens]|uniref:uncharacterized protein LOC141660889 n=1 Tax=Apium graveolens TaxID=4045 RepID=UPI003D7B208A
MIRPLEGLTPHLGGRLWQQYGVDAFTAMEQYRLDWIRDNQTMIRSDLYDIYGMHYKRVITILKMSAKQQFYLPHLLAVKDVVARVFKMKVDQMVDQIKNKNCFGRCIGVMHVIEFQKRGLPHAHMLIWLHPNNRPKTTDQIDKMVSAEIPDPSIDPVGYEAVRNYMIHGPCGRNCINSPSMAKGSCTKHFPKRYNFHTFFDDCGFPIYKRRKTGITVNKKGIELDNHYVVPYNQDLLIRFQCHTNLEICNSSSSLKYLFKYCRKGQDTATMCLRKKTTAKTIATTPITLEKCLIDEVKHYLDGRYKKGGVFFVYGSGGCGKTFLWQTLYYRLRSKRKIVLPVASYGIAAMLLPGGRTVHSRFHIPLKLDEHSSVGLRHGTDISELIQQNDLIIWDKAPMKHHHAFECVDRSLRYIMSDVDKRRAKKPFSGITIVFWWRFLANTSSYSKSVKS